MVHDAVTNLALWVVAVWTALVVVHALWQARRPAWDPAPPEPPEHHH
ncbi:MAG: hypothetical protein Kow0062_23370 [Acidobacteriota bacterium]